MSDGSEFQVCGAATESACRANSVRVLAADSNGASEDRRGRTGTAGWIRSCKLCWRWWRKHLERQRRHLVGNSLLHWQLVERPEKWFSIDSTSALTDDSGQVVLSPLQNVKDGGGRTVQRRKTKGRLFIQHHFSMPYPQSAQTWITQFYLQITPCLPFLRKRSPDGATRKWGSRHLIAATTHLLTLKGWKDELAWLADLQWMV